MKILKIKTIFKKVFEFKKKNGGLNSFEQIKPGENKKNNTKCIINNKKTDAFIKFMNSLKRSNIIQYIKEFGEIIKRQRREEQ